MSYFKAFLVGICLLVMADRSGATPGKLENVTIVVSSCDRYGDLWDPFFKLLFKYWHSLKTYNKDIPIILISNERDFAAEGVQVYKTGKDASWSSNMMKVLKSVKTKYVLYLQEDYLIAAPVDERRLQYLLEKMAQEHVVAIEFQKNSYFEKQPPFPGVEGAVGKDNIPPFKASLQAGLWEKSVFESLIKEGESAWDFEKEGTKRSRQIQEPFLALVSGIPISFVNACHLGFLEESAVTLLEREGMSLKSVGLPLSSDYPLTWGLRDIRPHILFRWWVAVLRFFNPKFAKNSYKG